MPTDGVPSSDVPRGDSENSRFDELARAIREFDEGETPTRDEVREAFLS